MSSTTSPDRQSGQALVLFALALVVLFGFGALAFDTGQMLLTRRTEQNAADAAALAGARYMVVPGGTTKAITEALRVAKVNGYGDGTSNGTATANGTTVTVSVPPVPPSKFAGRSGFIGVQISGRRGSILGGVLGMVGQRVSALATASNRSGVAANYSMIALDLTECPGAKFTGSGVVSVAGNIQVNSNCNSPSGAFNQGGSASVTVTSTGGRIDVVGNASCATGKCSPVPTEGSPVVPDPLLDLPAPGLPALPAPVVQLGSTTKTIPDACPGGSSPATALAPATCSFPSSYAGTTWQLSPGYYPGGISVQGGTLFLRPGVYYIGGGGLNATGTNGNIYSVSATWTGTTPPTCTTASYGDCGGVLIYNTNDPTATSGGSSVKNMQAIELNGSDSIFHLYGIQNAGPYTNIVFFQDRALPSSSASGDLQLNGSGANLLVQGTIYLPRGYVAVAGTGNLGPTQVIADTFQITGGGGLTVGYDQDVVAQLVAVGLVE